MLQNQGVLYGPWLHIYAIKPMKKNPVLLFLLCATVTGIEEYIIGFTGIHLFGMRLLEYRGLLWNIDGIICFRSVVSFALMGLVLHYLLEPARERMFMGMHPKTVHAVCLALLLVFSADCILSALFRTTIIY